MSGVGHEGGTAEPGGAERAGVLVLRVWAEPGAPQLLRARLVQMSDVETGESTVATAAGTPAICDAVEAWLLDFQRRASGTDVR